MKKQMVKILAAGLSILMLPFILTLLFAGIKKGSSSAEYMDFTILDKQDGSLKELTFTEYLIGVVAANMPAGYEIEALKAQAVIARTYTLYNIFLLRDDNPGQKEFTASELGLSYISPEEMRRYWDTHNYTVYYSKLENAVLGTGDKILTYDNELILPVFFNTGTGYTRNAREAWGVDIPYLVSVQSRQDTASVHYLKIIEYDLNKVIAAINASFPDSSLSPENFFDEVFITARDSTGYVTDMRLGGITVSGEVFANALGLYSNNFSMEEYGSKVRFVCTGVGHGVGLSQYGANAMALEGYNYEDILKHYYTDVRIVEWDAKD
jgi:stage II sporulation protein D